MGWTGRSSNTTQGCDLPATAGRALVLLAALVSGFSLIVCSIADQPPLRAAPVPPGEAQPDGRGGAAAASVGSWTFRPRWTQQSFAGHQGHEDAVVRHVNALRRGLGLSELVPDERLRVGARQHTLEMIQKGYYAHDSPVEAWKTPSRRACHAGYLEPYVSENIGLVSGFDDVAHAMYESWQKSPGHYRNMVDPKVTRIGVGLGSTTREGKVVWLGTQLFASDALEFRDLKVTASPGRVLRLTVSLDTTGGLEVKAWEGQSFLGDVPASGHRHTFTMDVPHPIAKARRVGFAIQVGNQAPLLCAHVEVATSGALGKEHADFHPLCRRVLGVKASAKSLVVSRRALSAEARANRPEARNTRFFLNQAWGPLLPLRAKQWVRFVQPLPGTPVVDFSLILTKLQKDYLRLDFRRADPFVCP